MSRTKSSVAEVVKRIIQHVYVAGQFQSPRNRLANDLAGKAFHLSRACELTDRFVDEFKNRSTAKSALLKAFKQSGATVQACNFREHQDSKPKPLGLLVDFLMGDVCHREVTSSIMEYFAVKNCPAILTEKSHAEARRILARLSRWASVDTSGWAP